jgi:phosphonate transport system permease protein
VRAASIIGFVGAGGIGQEIDVSIRLFRYSETATLVLAVLALVIGADTIGRIIRRTAR